MRASSTETSERMRRVRRRDTPAERELRSELHRLRLRYRVDRRPIPGLRRRADVQVSSLRLAIFVDGCFWHACPRHMTWPRANAAWWREKIEANRRRDIETTAALEAAGWTVVRVWEHEDMRAAARRIIATAEALRRGARERTP
jgi:DNA mismatch endonuclease (patch repair protein)